MSPTLRVSTHIYGVSMEIDGKHSFLNKPRYVTPQIQLSRKNDPCSEDFNTNFGVSKEIDGKTFIFKVNLSM